MQAGHQSPHVCAYAQGVKHISALGEALPVQIRNFDWHLFLKQVKERQTAQELWNSLSTFVVSCGMAVGTLDATGMAVVLAQHGPCCDAHRRKSTCFHLMPVSRAAAGHSLMATLRAGGLPGAPLNPKPRLQWQQRQAGLLRYNCADSLDRTNAASYFIAVQVWCRNTHQMQPKGLRYPRVSATLQVIFS